MTSHSLADLLRAATIYDLGQPYWNGMPVHPEDPPFQSLLYKYHEHTQHHFSAAAPGFADAISLVITSMHSGTHIDAPIHMSRDLKVLGHDITRYQDHTGFVGLPTPLVSMESVPPLILRAVLLDVAASKGVDILPERYAITPADLTAAAEFAGVSIAKDDCVLVRTGYSRYFQTDAERYLRGFAGLSTAAAASIAEWQPKVLGIDNLSIGVPLPFEAHNILLSDHGIFTMKGLDLEKLTRDAKYESSIVILPLKIRGGEASLVRPIAIA